MDNVGDELHSYAWSPRRVALVAAVAAAALFLPVVTAATSPATTVRTGSPRLAGGRVDTDSLRLVADVKGASAAGAATTGKAIDHGGKVLAASHVYVIWWGPSAAWASDVAPGMAKLFGSLNGSSYAKTAVQYLRGAALTTALSGVKSDPSTPPASPTAATLGTEAAKEYGALDPSGIYFVFTSNYPPKAPFCAWHDTTSVNKVSVAVAYMPNTTGAAGCDPGNLYGVAGSQGLRSLANDAAHEFTEAVTDPFLTAWYDSSGNEVGDKCGWTFSAPVTLAATTWQLQEEWSNVARACVQTTP